MSADERTEAGVSEEAVEAAARAIAKTRRSRPEPTALDTVCAEAAIKALVDGGHYVPTSQIDTFIDTVKTTMAERDAAVAALAEAVELLRDTNDELRRWGHGDMHYGRQKQEASVRERVERNDLWLARQEHPVTREETT